MKYLLILLLICTKAKGQIEDIPYFKTDGLIGKIYCLKAIDSCMKINFETGDTIRVWLLKYIKPNKFPIGVPYAVNDIKVTIWIKNGRLAMGSFSKTDIKKLHCGLIETYKD